MRSTVTPDVPDDPPEMEWRFALGGQIETAPHGVLDLGWRRGPLSIQLFTDTLDLRAKPNIGGKGALDVGLRGAAFAAGMWIDPWTNGVPDPIRAARVAYLGPDARIERWLPYGAYLAAETSLRWHVFTPLPGSMLEIPDQAWFKLDAVLGGWWGDGRLQTSLVAGLDQTTAGVTSPHAGIDLIAHPDGRLAPIGEWRASIARGQDDVVATRLGGMTPYHVPLAGAAWAEFWVEDFTAARAGLRVRGGPVTAGAVLDAAGWSYPDKTLVPLKAGTFDAAAGIAGLLRVEYARWFGEVSVGHSTIARPDGISPVSVWLLAGTRWRSSFELEER